jgi:hypothetical protein
MSQVALQHSGIGPFIRQNVSGRVSKHVGMDLKRYLGGGAPARSTNFCKPDTVNALIRDIERVLLGPRTAQQIVGSLIAHSAALISPGNEKRAQSGLMRRMGIPPAVSDAGSASA